MIATLFGGPQYIVSLAATKWSHLSSKGFERNDSSRVEKNVEVTKLKMGPRDLFRCHGCLVIACVRRTSLVLTVLLDHKT